MARRALWGALWACLLAAPAVLPACNSPYPDSEEGQSILYASFFEEPKRLDPARSYGTGEAGLLAKVIEPPFMYHYLKRPYELAPLTAREVPRPERRKVTFRDKPFDATVYTVRIQPGIVYQDHACFVEANRRLTEADARAIHSLWDIQRTATRELVAADYVHAIRRLADPRLACPVFATLSKNLLGMVEYRDEIQRRLDEVRARRRQAAGPLYNQEQDEVLDPIRLDYAAAGEGFPFVREVDRYSFEVVLPRPYPQMLYWMAMTFFSPVPPEAVEFFDQPVMCSRGIEFNKSPVGTGPYKLREYDPTNQIVFVRNANWRGGVYPDLPRPDPNDAEAVANYREMQAAGMLDDAGKPLASIQRIVYRMEKESIPRWNKFLQGYYDNSPIANDLFDQAVTLSSRGEAALTDDLTERGIRLLTSYPTTVSYYAFNMNDPVIGGYTERARKLRQAISIAFNIEDEIAIFANGRGIVAHSPLPPGIFGHDTGQRGCNPVVFRWDEQRKAPVRRSLEEARKLLAEAGYPGGYGADGQPLSIRFATTASGAESQAWLRFIRKQFEKLNIRLIPEITDYNRFQDKVIAGNYQFLRWGWAADYPDPENFMFLLYGPSGKTVSQGENVPNYQNAEYDRLFEQMENMENTPQRLEIIRKMVDILREDSPWIFGFHPVGFGLFHGWVYNSYPHEMAYNTTRYVRLDTAARTAYRKVHNAPRVWPVAIFLAAVVVLTVPAVRAAARHLRET